MNILLYVFDLEIYICYGFTIINYDDHELSLSCSVMKSLVLIRVFMSLYRLQRPLSSLLPCFR